ncbi:MAG: AAA family ATPase [Bacteroidota bacterium]
MIVSRIKLKNWKNFRNIDVLLQDRVFIVGANASGKSNFLDAFRFLRDIAKPSGGLQTAILQERGGISKIRCLAARAYPDVELEVYLSEFGSRETLWKYAIGIKQESRGYRLPYLTYERIWKGNTLILNRPNKEDKEDKARLTQTHLEQINTNKEFREISRFFESILYLHIVPQLLKYPKAFTGPDLPGDPFGRGFLERIARVNTNTRTAWLKRIENALRFAVPQLEKLNYTDELGIPHLEAIYTHWRNKGAKQKENQFSDGTLRLIGLLWSLQEGDSLLLLEEPELSLNGAIISKIGSLIFQIQKQKKRQVILTSHSSDLLNDKGIRLDEIVILEPNNEGTKADIASGIKEVKLMLSTGMSPAAAILPRTKPKNVNQLSFNF